MRNIAPRLATMLAATSLAAAAPAFAQSTAQIPLEFDFLNPGARSLSMGSAFVGAADDATSSFANPAGLAFLSTLEVTVEGRYRGTTTPFLSGGRLSGEVSGLGLDTITGPVYDEDIDRQFGAMFVSLTVPGARIGPTADPSPRFDRYSIAVYRHELARIDNSFFGEGTFERAAFAGEVSDLNRDIPLGGTRQLSITSYGTAVGVNANGHLAFGGAVVAHRFHVESRFARYGFASTIFGPVDRTQVLATAAQDGDDLAVSGTGGVLWRSRDTQTPPLKVGVTFRQGPRFSFAQVDRDIPSGAEIARQGSFKVPDVWAAGVEWRATGNLRILGDYDYVRYSQLKADFIDFQAIASGRQDRLQLDDGHEVHGGAEYLVLNVMPLDVALRVGAWFDPDHSIRYLPTAAGDTLDVRLAAALPGRDDLVHYTFGAGLLIGGLELNFGADLSSRTRHATASGVWRF